MHLDVHSKTDPQKKSLVSFPFFAYLETAFVKRLCSVGCNFLKKKKVINIDCPSITEVWGEAHFRHLNNSAAASFEACWQPQSHECNDGVMSSRPPAVLLELWFSFFLSFLQRFHPLTVLYWFSGWPVQMIATLQPSILLKRGNVA